MNRSLWQVLMLEKFTGDYLLCEDPHVGRGRVPGAHLVRRKKHLRQHETYQNTHSSSTSAVQWGRGREIRSRVKLIKGGAGGRFQS